MQAGLGRKAVAGGLVVVLLLVSGILASCTTTATIKVTLKDMAGAALSGITMTVGDKTGTSNASGQVTVQGVAPGQVTLKFTGNGYDAEKAETVQKGNNEFSYQLSRSFAFRDFSEIQSHRIRVTAPGLYEPAEAVFVRGGGTYWKMQEGVEIVHLGDVLYFKAGPNQGWQKIVGTGQTGFILESIVGMANQFLGELQAFDSRLSDGSIQAQWDRSEDVNGYHCDVFVVNWSADTFSGSYTVHVIAQGDAKGFVTRYQWTIEGLGSTVYDIWDINANLEVKAPI